MCGIMGYVRTKNGGGATAAKRQEMLEALLLGIESRGPHATGIGMMSDQITLYGKAPVRAKYFLMGEAWEKAMSLRPRLLIGHARWATNGSPKVNSNNHPHVSKNHHWMIVHNGIIRDKVEGVETTTECDSEVVLRLLESHGVQETVKIMNGFKSSSYAILALDTRTKTLYAWRNSSPCVVADLSEQAGGIVFCSTKDILIEAAKRAKVSLKGVTIYSLKPGWTYSFPMGMAGGLEKLKLPAAKTETQKAIEDWMREGKLRKGMARRSGSENIERAVQLGLFDYYNNAYKRFNEDW